MCCDSTWQCLQEFQWRENFPFFDGDGLWFSPFCCTGCWLSDLKRNREQLCGRRNLISTHWSDETLWAHLFFFLSPLKSKATLCEPDRSSGSSWHFQKKDFIKVIWRWYKKKFIQICKNMTIRYWLIVRLNSCDYPIYPSIDLSRTFKSWTRHLVIW